MKKKIATLFSIIIFILCVSSVKAFPPSDHILQINDLYSDSRFSSISPTFYNVMVNNKAYVEAGMEMTDMTIPTYWTSYVLGGTKYGATHNFAFQQCLWTSAVNDQQRAIAMGNAMHILQDSVIHNGINNMGIPSVIRTYGVPNIPVHPIYELGDETVLRRDMPYLATQLQTSLQPILSDPSMIAFIDNCMSKQTGVGSYDTKSALEFLNSAFGEGGWAMALNLPNYYASFAYGNTTYGIVTLVIIVLLGLGLWKIENKWVRIAIAPFIIIFGIATFLFLFGGIANFSNVSAFPALRAKAEDRVIYYLQTQNWDKRWGIDGTGFNNLHAADNDVLTFWYAMVGIFVLVVTFAVYKIIKDR